jgi:Xaa-Pro aminopeptidase
VKKGRSHIDPQNKHNGERDRSAFAPVSFIYSTSEIRKRRERAQALMQEENLDGLLITNVENFIYFVGMPGAFGLHSSNDRPAVAFLPREGEITCVVSAYEAPKLHAVLRAGNIREYRSIISVPNNVYVDALKDSLLRKRRIGIEAGGAQRIGMPYEEFTELLRSFSSITFVDAARLIWKMRMIKSDEEIRYMKKAADITGRARQRCFDEISSGMTYREVANLFGKFVLELGGDGISFVIVDSQPQDGMKIVPLRYVSLIPNKPIKKGEALFVDGGAKCFAYTVDYNRWATMGRASERFVRQHRIIRAVSHKMAEAMKPGATCSDIYKIAHRELKHSGVFPETLSAGRMGHGMGMLFTEPPSLSDSDHTVLEAGLVLSSEPVSYAEGVRLVWEDVFVVTDDGAELITQETPELRELR